MFTSGPIDGVILKDLKTFNDSRGWLVELFRNDELSPGDRPVMAYTSLTNPGIARGPHEHVHQSDLFCFIGPSTFRLYMWDNRKTSPSYMKRQTVDVGEKSPKSVIIPPGVVHAYRNIGSEAGIVYNFANRLYAGDGKKEPVDEIRHEQDPNTIFKLD